jgi:pSer/pThr/pTyr-binding forkhead associated (FHA) protein
MLVVERGVPGVRVIPLDQQVCIIGASPSADIFVDNPYISRMHAQIVYEGERFRIRDLDSKNGTYVNRARLTTEGHVLQRGDRIELADGQVLLRFQTRSTTVTLPAASAEGNGDLVVDTKSRDVWVRGEKLESPLSRKEFDVLGLLVEKRGEVCSKDEIASAGWPERAAGDVGDQEIEQSIRRLRLRIEQDPSQPQYIVTVRGHGYKLSK